MQSNVLPLLTPSTPGMGWGWNLIFFFESSNVAYPREYNVEQHLNKKLSFTCFGLD